MGFADLRCCFLLGSEICASVLIPDDSEIPGGKIVATNLESKETFGGTTDEVGQVCLSKLKAGSYALEASRSGFLPNEFRQCLQGPASPPKSPSISS